MRQDQHHDSAGRAARTISGYPTSAAMNCSPRRDGHWQRCGGARIPAWTRLSSHCKRYAPAALADGAVHGDGLVFPLRRVAESLAWASDQRQQPAVSCLEVLAVTTGHGMLPHDARGRRARPRPAGPLPTGPQAARQAGEGSALGSPSTGAGRIPAPLAGRVSKAALARARPVDRCVSAARGTGSRHNPVGRPVGSSCGPVRVVIIRAFGHGGTSPTTGASWPAAQPDPPAHGDGSISARHPNGHEGRPP